MTAKSMDVDSASQRDGAVSASDQHAVEADKTLLELLSLMESYKPLIPDAVIEYYMATSGVKCEDIRLKRLFGIIAQKFVADVASGAFQYAKVRHQAVASREKKLSNKEKKMTLTMDDLAPTLAEFGVNLNKPGYYT